MYLADSLYHYNLFEVERIEQEKDPEEIKQKRKLEKKTINLVKISRLIFPS